MKKLFKRIRLWLIKKLKAIPKENAYYPGPNKVTQSNMRFVTLGSSQRVSTELLFDDQYAESVYRILCNNITDELWKFAEIETEDSEFPEFKTVRMKIYVGIKEN